MQHLISLYAFIDITEIFLSKTVFFCQYFEILYQLWNASINFICTAILLLRNTGKYIVPMLCKDC